MVRIAALAICLALVGCAGSSFKWSDVRRVRAGMTPAEVTATIGSAPYLVRSEGESEVWVWTWVNMMSGLTRSATVTFRDGVVAEVPVIPKSFKG